MEEAKIGEDWDSDCFLDAVDEFLFLDCEGNAESGEPADQLKLEIVEVGADEVLIANNSAESPFRNGIRRRSSFRSSRQGGSGDNAKDANCDLPEISEISQVSGASIHTEKRSKILCALKDHEKVRENFDSLRFRSSSGRFSSVDEEDGGNSTLTSDNKVLIDESATGDSHKGDHEETPSNFLVFWAELMIKAIEFQFSLLVSFISFPIWLSYSCFKFARDPFQTVRQGKGYFSAELFRMWAVFYDSVSPFVNERLKGHKVIGKLIARFGWGLFWSVYVCFMLFGLLVLAFIIGAIIMRYLVEEPIHMMEALNFDYTKNSPVAFVPVMDCPYVSCGVKCKGKVEVGKHVGSRVIPLNHKLQLSISLTLPESDYNRKLGVFQVRVDFLSANGKVTSTSSHPCMLQFKSQPILFLETFLKTASLIAGYSSESQIVKMKMRGLTEEKEPTACLRVVLEQRAEYRPGAGIPEIYAASLVLESELPLFKRIIWCWKKTIFIWTSMMSFMMELMLILVCCRPIIIPRLKLKDGSIANGDSPQNTVTQSKDN